MVILEKVNQMNFEERIQVYECKLNDTDDQIIEYIQKNHEKVLTISIQKLAEELFTVPNTIIRLAKKLGYEGFSELKLALKRGQGDQEKDFLDISDSLKKTYEIMKIDVIDIVARKIKQSSKVLFYGVGDSLPFCIMMTKHLQCVGKKSEYFMHRNEMEDSARQVKQKEVVFVISASGETKQVLEAVEIAKVNGAFIISLTHLSDNSLAKMASLNLYCWAPKNKLNHYDITDRTSLSIVLRILSEYYWGNMVNK